MKLQLRDQCKEASRSICTSNPEQHYDCVQPLAITPALSLCFLGGLALSSFQITPETQLSYDLSCIVSLYILRDHTKISYGSKQPNKPEQQACWHHGPCGFTVRKAEMWWSFPWGNALLDLTLLSSSRYLWSHWSPCISHVTNSSCRWGRICCVVSGNVFGW